MKLIISHMYISKYECIVNKIDQNKVEKNKNYSLEHMLTVVRTDPQMR